MIDGAKIPRLATLARDDKRGNPTHRRGDSQGGSGGNVGFTAVQSASSLGRLKSPRNMRKFLGDSLHTFSSVRKYAPGRDAPGVFLVTYPGSNRQAFGITR